MAVDLFTESRTRGSTVRHRPIRTGAAPEPLSRRTTRQPENKEWLETSTARNAKLIPYRQRAGRSALETSQDSQIAPSVRQQPYALVPPHKGIPPMLWIIVGMMAVLVLWFFGVRVYAWYTNTFSDPAYYTQAAHLDTTTVTDTQGNQSQVRAFIDGQGHLDLLIMPDDPSKFRVVVGGALMGIDQEQAILTITTKGTMVTVTAQGPLQAVWFTTYRQSAQWTYDVSQKPSGG